MLDLRAVSDYLAAFDACYRVGVVGSGLLRYERIALPEAGGVLEQPAMVMEALDEMERIANEELAADARARRPTGEGAR